jgi:hypothetical protein
MKMLNDHIVQASSKIAVLEAKKYGIETYEKRVDFCKWLGTQPRFDSLAQALKVYSGISEDAPVVKPNQATAQKQSSNNRRKLNNHLRSNGYRWHKEYADHDAYEETGETVWRLRFKDGRQVTVDQAIEEISRGREAVMTEIEQAAKNNTGLSYPAIY